MLRSNKGSISLYVLMTMIFILVLVSGIYMTSTSKEISGLKETEAIKNLYQKDVDNVDKIYEQLISSREYIKEGLIVHYDGINNTQQGHNQTSKVWEDLSGNGNDAILKTDNVNWEEKCFSFTNPTIDFFETENYIDLGTSPRTIEIVCSISNLESQNIMGLGYEQENQLFDVVINNNSFNYNFYNNEANEGIEQALITNTIYSTAFIYNQGVATYRTNDTTKTDVQLYDLDTRSTRLKIGQGISSLYNNDNAFKIYSIRIYDRVLTQEEINNNYNIDKNRYFNI